MFISSVYFIALLVGSDAAAVASLAGPQTSLLQFPEIHVPSPGQETSLLQSTDGISIYGHWSFMEGNFGLVADDAPTWCKNETQLTWTQRKERMQQHNTLQWAKKMVQTIQEAAGPNATIPEWMDKLVSDDEKRGKARWSVQESKRMKAEGKETPRWMDDLVAEDNRWANRWAACKVAQLKAVNEEAPAWMVENGRKGVMEAATEKAEELQDDIEELDSEKEEEAALVDAHGDATLASQKMLALTKAARTTTLSQQIHVLGDMLEELNDAEVEYQIALKKHDTSIVPNVIHDLKRTMRKAEDSAHLLSKMLDRKMHAAKTQFGA